MVCIQRNWAENGVSLLLFLACIAGYWTNAKIFWILKFCLSPPRPPSLPVSPFQGPCFSFSSVLSLCKLSVEQNWWHTFWPNGTPAKSYVWPFSCPEGATELGGREREFFGSTRNCCWFCLLEVVVVGSGGGGGGGGGGVCVCVCVCVCVREREREREKAAPSACVVFFCCFFFVWVCVLNTNNR